MFPGTDSPTMRLMASQTWFARLPLATQAHILGSVFHITGKKGELMLPANVPVQGWYAVLTGLVKLQSVPVKGCCATFLGVACGDWFGEGSALNAETRRYEVVAMRDSELLCLPQAEFDHLFATCIEFNQFLVKQMNLRVKQAMAVVEATRVRSPEQRVALSLSPLFWNQSRKLNLSQDELASLVGISRQTTNRALKSLAQRGLVSLEFGRVDIPDHNALTAFIFSTAEPQEPSTG
jgi:CRP/FNR family cyclic AMP-dependent transcriptional regulator